MATDFKQSLNDLVKLYGDLGTSKKLIIAGVAAVALAAFSYLILFGAKMDYDYLFTNIDQSDAGEIVTMLKEKKVDFIIEDESIKVPRDKVHELRMELASEGLPAGKGVGFEIFDNQKLGTSQFVQNLNMKRALQGELSRTISQLNEVEVARVHLVMPKKVLFKEDQSPPTASVVVKLKAGAELEGSEIKAIVHLVSSSVEGLPSKNVTIIDSNGNMLSRAAIGEEQIWGSSPLEYKTKVEQDMAKRVEEIVAHVVGIGKVVSRVTVELDFKKEEKTEEIFDPDQVVVRSEKRIKENRKNSEVSPGGVPGAQSNTPEGPLATGNQNSNADTARDLINYEINKVVRRTIREAGDLKRISVAVLVDGSYTTEEKDGELTTKYVPRDPTELVKIKEMVQSAVGYDAERGDSVVVTNVAFETSMMDEEEFNQSFLQRYDFIPVLLRYLIILALAALIVFFLFRPLITWVIGFHEEERLREVEKQQEDVVKSMEEQLLEVRKTIEVSTTEYKKKIVDVVDQAPELVAGVIRQWLRTED